MTDPTPPDGPDGPTSPEDVGPAGTPDAGPDDGGGPEPRPDPTPGGEGLKLHTYVPEEPTSVGRAREALAQIPAWGRALLLAALPLLAISWFLLSGDDPSDEPGTLPPLTESFLADTTPARSFEPLSESSLDGMVGTEIVLSGRALNPGRSPMADTLVVWRVEAGAGELESDSTRTDAEGIARITLRLPPEPGEVVVVGRVAGAGLPEMRYTVRARSGAPSRVAVVRGNRQSGRPGTLLAQPLTVRVTDVAGNPVADTEIRFQVLTGGGGVAPSRVRTDARGVASTRWRLGATPGAQQVAALAPDADDAVTAFQATALATTEDASPASPTPSGSGEAVGGEETRPSPEPAPGPAVLTVARRPYSVGGGIVCALVRGEPRCRGADDRSQSEPGSPPALRALAAGVSHVCGLDDDGQAFCWGGNEAGQLGDGSRSDRAGAEPVSTELRFAALAAGLAHTCGLERDGSLSCWGRNLNGQLGDGSREDRPTPRAVASDDSFRSLVAGWNHTCGLTSDGRALCWGLNAGGQLGDGSRLDRLAPTAVPGSFTALAAGSAHTCGIRGDAVLCWGDNTFGQLGDGSQAGRTRPTPVRNLPARPVALATGAVHTCALLEDGALYCWGQNLHGQLGDGTNQNRSAPVAVSGGVTFATLHAGGAMTCGFGTDGAEYCWGLNQSGQLGDGTRTNRSSPTRVGG